MGWSVGYDRFWQRDIGYGVPAVCDHPDCNTKIDRGLSYVCGGEPYGGRYGCGLYFCDKHLTATDRCLRCCAEMEPYTPKPDTAEWLNHKETNESWSEWRAERDVKLKRKRRK